MVVSPRPTRLVARTRTSRSGDFNGRILYCIAHGWVFDGHSGKCLQPTGWAMKEYPMRIENGMVQVDVTAA